MELGGKSPLVIFDDASVDDAVGAAMLANFYSAGQICSNGTRVFVQKGLKARFLAQLKSRTEAIVIGEPLDEGDADGPAGQRGASRQGDGLCRGGLREGAR